MSLIGHVIRIKTTEVELILILYKVNIKKNYYVKLLKSHVVFHNHLLNFIFVRSIGN